MNLRQNFLAQRRKDRHRRLHYFPRKSPIARSPRQILVNSSRGGQRAERVFKLCGGCSILWNAKRNRSMTFFYLKKLFDRTRCRIRFQAIETVVLERGSRMVVPAQIRDQEYTQLSTQLWVIQENQREPNPGQPNLPKALPRIY